MRTILSATIFSRCAAVTARTLKASAERNSSGAGLCVHAGEDRLSYVSAAIQAEPAASAKTLVLSGAIVFVKLPPHKVNRYVEVLNVNSRMGWFPAGSSSPIAAPAIPMRTARHRF